MAAFCFQAAEMRKTLVALAVIVALCVGYVVLPFASLFEIVRALSDWCLDAGLVWRLLHSPTRERCARAGGRSECRAWRSERGVEPSGRRTARVVAARAAKLLHG